MSDQDVYERILALLHEAAFDDARWLAASGLIDTACRTQGSILVFGEGRVESGIEIFFSRLCYRGQHNLELEREYYADYYASDEHLPRLRQLPDSYIVHISDLITEEEMKTSRTYNEFLLRAKFQNSLNVRLDGPDGGSRIAWCFADPVDGGSWSSAQVEMIQRLLPHVRQFIGVRQALADARALGSSLAGLLDNSLAGVIQLDTRGRIVAANDRALAMLRRGDGLFDEGGILQTSSRDDQVVFDKVLSRALPRFRGPGASGTVVVRRTNALSHLVLHVTPVQDLPEDGRARRVAALVLVVDPMSPVRIDPGMVRGAFGLTPAESQVAALLGEGKSLRDIAAVTGRSEGTVRWHLKQIFRKTGLSRQAELVQLVLSLAGLPAPRN